MDPSLALPDAGAAVVGSAPGRNRRRIYLVVGVLVLLVGAGVVWDRVAAQRVGQVSVMWTAYPQCAGAKVLDVEDEWFDDTWSGPVIGAQRGMRCVISVEVRNNSGGTVRVDEANLMFMGPGAGAIVKVDTSADPHLWDVLSPFDDRDLIRSLGVTLEPGEQTTFDVPVVFRDGGCNGGAGGGGQTIIHGFPVVTVSTLLRSFKAVAVNDLAFSQHGPSRGCARA